MSELKLEVDENNLLNEWKGQAQLMLDYGTKLADALEARDTAKADLAVVAAKLATRIRANPEEFDCAKVTEATVAEIVVVHPEHITATKRLIKAQHDAKLLEATVDAVGQRKSTLQGMTDLFLRQWYADPTSAEQPRELREAAGGGPPMKTIPGRRVRRSREE